jgi:hypothetical protein
MASPPPISPRTDDSGSTTTNEDSGTSLSTQSSNTSRGDEEPLSRWQVPGIAQETVEQIYASPSKTTGENLERLSRALMHHINIRSYSAALSELLTSDFRGAYNALYLALSSKEHIASIGNVLKVSPDYHLRVQNSSSNVDEEKGSATVWVFSSVHGIPFHKNVDGIVRETVIVFYWRRKREGWRNWKQVAIRGPSGFT